MAQSGHSIFLSQILIYASVQNKYKMLTYIVEFSGEHKITHLWTGGVRENGTWHWGDPTLTWIPWNGGQGQPDNNVHHTHIALMTPHRGKYLFTVPEGNIYVPFCEQSNQVSGVLFYSTQALHGCFYTFFSEKIFCKFSKSIERGYYLTRTSEKAISNSFYR